TPNPAQHLPAFSINYNVLFHHPVYFHMLTNFCQAMCLTFTSLQKKTGGWGVNVLANSSERHGPPTWPRRWPHDRQSSLRKCAARGPNTAPPKKKKTTTPHRTTSPHQA